MRNAKIQMNGGKNMLTLNDMEKKISLFIYKLNLYAE